MSNRPTLIEYTTVGCSIVIAIVGILSAVAVPVAVVLILWRIW
jgi:hypothetical protein